MFISSESQECFTDNGEVRVKGFTHVVTVLVLWGAVQACVHVSGVSATVRGSDLLQITGNLLFLFKELFFLEAHLPVTDFLNSA